jgi:hypothetical protein
MDLHSIQHIAGVHGHGVGCTPAKLGGIHQREIVDPHISHRPGHSANVTRVPGPNENDAQICQAHMNRAQSVAS